MISFIKIYGLALIASVTALALSIFLSEEVERGLLVLLPSVIWAGCAWFYWQKIYRFENSLRASQTQFGQLKKSLQALLGEAEACTEQEISTVNDELQQVKSVVSDAVVSMNNSFNSLNGLSTEQNSLVLSLVSELSESTGNKASARVNFSSFALEIDRVLKFFVENVLTTSKQSMEMVNLVNDVGGYMEKIEKLLTDVQQIADQTNLLALNAAIEAARAGESGRGFAVVADEVRALSKHSDRFSDQIRDVISESQHSINQAKAMIEQMASKDMTFAIQSKMNVDEMTGEIEELNEQLSKKLNTVSSITEQIESGVGTAVRALQFEDLTRQLVEGIEDNTSHLRALVQEVKHAIDGLPEEMGQSWLDTLDRKKSRIVEVKQEWREQNKVVVQNSMDEGEIELF